MFRLLGFLIGSLTSILIILLLIGVPKFHLTDEDETQHRYDAAIEMLREKQQEIESVTGRLSEDMARVAESVDHGIDDPAPPGTEVPAEIEKATIESVAATDTAPSAVVEPAIPDDLLWYSFWNPFRSEIAANGFVSQLEKVTGIDYRVVKVKTGVYEVAFAYHDDTERATKLSQISMATGLELPES